MVMALSRASMKVPKNAAERFAVWMARAVMAIPFVMSRAVEDNIGLATQHSQFQVVM
jgi:hypothetical protein